MTFLGLIRFPVGTRVQYVNDRGYGSITLTPGECGTVVGIDNSMGLEPPIVYCVDWDNKGAARHDCDGLSRPMHGWNVTEGMIREI